MSMPIDRTKYNALVDDDGSNRTGTPWNKQQIKDVLLDPVDAARTWTLVQLSINGGDFPNFAPGIVGDTVIVLTGTGGTIYGFKLPGGATPQVGQRIVVHCVIDPSAFTNFYHEHAGAEANCQISCRKSPAVSISGYWSWAEFQFGLYNGGGRWMMGGYGNGIGGP